MSNIDELAISFGRFISERDELHVDDINDEVVEEVVREFIKQVLKGRTVEDEDLARIHVAVENGLIDGATVNEMEG